MLFVQFPCHFLYGLDQIRVFFLTLLKLEAMATTKMSLKLLVDTKANKVLFAEAGKDFVDFLFGLLSLPVGAVLKLLKGRSSVGCIGNVYQSFENWNESYMQPNLHKDILLDPKVSTSVTNIPLLIDSSNSTRTTTPKKLYRCDNCCGYVTDGWGNPCLACHSGMTRDVTDVEGNGVSPGNANATGNGFVQGLAMYMVTDDLSVTPMSMVSAITMLNKFNVPKLDVLEERVVEVGMNEALELLKASFLSEATLSAVFLRKEGCSDAKSFGTSPAASDELPNEMKIE